MGRLGAQSRRHRRRGITSGRGEEDLLLRLDGAGKKPWRSHGDAETAANSASTPRFGTLAEPARMPKQTLLTRGEQRRLCPRHVTPCRGPSMSMAPSGFRWLGGGMETSWRYRVDEW